MEDQLLFLDKKLRIVTNAVEEINSDLLQEVKILEIEKNKIRLELGARKNVVISEDHDDSSVWGTIALLAQSMNTSPLQRIKGDSTSNQVLEAWAKSKINSIEAMIKVMNGELQHIRSLDALKSDVLNLKTDNSRLNDRLNRLEAE